MRILVDTNVIMDVVIKRVPFSGAARQVLRLCALRRIHGCVAAHSITNLFFILRKHLSAEQRRKMLLRLCKMLTVVGVDAKKLVRALRNNAMDDFEDCLQAECAKEFRADYIVTRNGKDFAGSAVPVVEPEEFLRMISP